ncbi:hypothetical protein TPA0907_16850 [Micromonospora humidisoli]|nr:hypothetical protein TPA0907_16850 [Micromonospora sp. AKA109]
MHAILPDGTATTLTTHGCAGARGPADGDRLFGHRRARCRRATRGTRGMVPLTGFPQNTRPEKVLRRIRPRTEHAAR